MPGELDSPESNAERQAAEVISNLLRGHPLPEGPKAPRQRECALSSPEAQRLNCVAIVRNGKMISIVDLAGTPEAKTPGEKMLAFVLIARTILNGLYEALEFWEYRRKEREGDGNEEGPCHV